MKSFKFAALERRNAMKSKMLMRAIMAEILSTSTV